MAKNVNSFSARSVAESGWQDQLAASTQREYMYKYTFYTWCALCRRKFEISARELYKHQSRDYTIYEYIYIVYIKYKWGERESGDEVS